MVGVLAVEATPEQQRDEDPEEEPDQRAADVGGDGNDHRAMVSDAELLAAADDYLTGRSDRLLRMRLG